jgi:hypothetical protein
MAGEEDMNKRALQGFAFLGLALIWLLLVGCGESRDPYVGTYRTVEKFGGKDHVELVLKDNGECTWTLEGKTLKFKWKVDAGRIWLYTKEGGIIIVTPAPDKMTLSADLSGEWHPGCPPDKCVYFKRVGGGTTPGKTP